MKKLELNESFRIKISASATYVPTGLTFCNDNVYKLESKGTWFDLFIPSSADGFTNSYMRLFDGKKRVKNSLWMCLMGTFDKVDVFEIGNKLEYYKHVLVDQELLCFANDAKGWFFRKNNSGSITLKITRIE